MLRYEDGDPLLRPIQRRETTPARMMGQPPPEQPTSSFERRVPAPLRPVIRDGAQMPAYYAPYYPGGPPQAVPMYYQPQPMQFISVPPQPSMPEPGHIGLSTGPLPSVRQRSRSRRRTSVDSKEYTRSKSHSRSRPFRERRQSDSAYDPSDRERGRAPSPSPVRIARHDHYDNYDSDSDVDIRVRTRRRRISEYVPYTDGFDDTASSTIYSFTPSRMSRAASTQPGIHSDDELPGKEEADADGGDPRKDLDRTLRLSHIFESLYSGDQILGGSHSVKLTAVSNSKLKYQPLFRWL